MKLVNWKIFPRESLLEEALDAYAGILIDFSLSIICQIVSGNLGIGEFNKEARIEHMTAKGNV